MVSGFNAKRSGSSPCTLGGVSRAFVVALSIVVCVSGVSSAQDEGTDTDTAAVEKIPYDRGGFTLLLTLGAGYQNDAALSESAWGLGGLNLGIGGFLNEDLALMFRVSGTNVSYDVTGGGSVSQVSGVGGVGVQYWPNDKVNVEGAVGMGFWDLEGTSDQSFGLILGAAYAFFNSGKHNLQVGLEYAPAFTDPDTVHNLGIVFGWQFL